MRKEHKMQVVSELDRRGFFLIKQAAETAATALGVTRFTIYNYLNELGGEVEKTA
jgi:predicted transcriptional regulator YheO